MSRRYASLAVLLGLCIVLSGQGRGHAQQPSGQQRWPLVRGKGVCFAKSGWCPINGTLPVGAACYCTIPPNTHIYGTVMALDYWGHVSPYFNVHGPSVPATIR